MAAVSRRNSWIITIAIAAGTVGYLTLLFSPGMRGIAGVRQELRTKQDFIGQAERLRPTTFRLGEQLTQVAQYNQRWSAYLVSQSRLASIYGELGALVKDSGASTTRFEPQTAIPLASVKKLPVKLGLEGSFTQIHAVIHKIESLAAFIWIEEIKMEGGGETGKSSRAELTLAMFVDNPEKSD
jgi:Tfp pilus assembly protein PilO